MLSVLFWLQGQDDCGERPQEDENILQSATDICQSAKLAQMSSFLSLYDEGSVVCLEEDKVVPIFCRLLLDKDTPLAALTGR